MSEEELKAFRNLNTFSTKYIVNKKASSENDIATMFIYIAKLEVELEHKDKEIERIKELSIVDSQQSQEIIIELKQEIERLNNIINKAKEYMEQNYSAIVGRIEKIYKILDKGDYND